MADITLKGNPIKTSGQLPAVGEMVPAFSLTNASLEDVGLDAYAGKKRVLNIFPSVDTATCATSVRTFNKKASDVKNVVVLNISADLPFATKRFCAAEGLDGVDTLSSFRSTFATDYGLKIENGPLAGLCSRAVIVVDEDGKVVYAEQVAEIVDEPNYDAALAALK